MFANRNLLSHTQVGKTEFVLSLLNSVPFLPHCCVMNSSPTQNWVLLPLHDQEVDDWAGNHSGNTELPKPSFNLLNKGSVQLFSPVQLSATPWTAACQASLSVTNSWSLLKPMSTESVMPSNHLVLCPLLLPLIFPSIRVFSNESVLCIRWPKYWSFSFSISPSNEHSGLISSRIDWFDLLAVQGTLKSLLQHHSSKASILWHPALFMSISHIHI